MWSRNKIVWSRNKIVLAFVAQMCLRGWCDLVFEVEGSGLRDFRWNLHDLKLNVKDFIDPYQSVFSKFEGYRRKGESILMNCDATNKMFNVDSVA